MSKNQIDSRDFPDQEAYRAALKKQFSRSREESREEYESRVEKVSVPSRYGHVFRNASIAILALFLAVLGLFFGKNILEDYRSRENVETLQAAASLPESAPVMVEIPVVESDAGEPEQSEEEDGEKAQVVYMLSRYAPLYQENPDFCGWLRIPETDINYPVMHLDYDNDYYLGHNFYGEEDVNGLLVLDKRCKADGSGNHLLVHGHNMKSGFMFGGLKKYKDQSYYETHPRIDYDTLTEERTYQIISVFLSSTNLADDGDFHYYDYIDIEAPEDFDAYVSAAKQQSLYDTGESAEYGDRLITLSTCDYTKDNGRLIIVGKEITD